MKLRIVAAPDRHPPHPPPRPGLLLESQGDMLTWEKGNRCNGYSLRHSYVLQARTGKVKTPNHLKWKGSPHPHAEEHQQKLSTDTELVQVSIRTVCQWPAWDGPGEGTIGRSGRKQKSDARFRTNRNQVLIRISRRKGREHCGKSAGNPSLGKKSSKGTSDWGPHELLVQVMKFLIWFQESNVTQM